MFHGTQVARGTGSFQFIRAFGGLNPRMRCRKQPAVHLRPPLLLLLVAAACSTPSIPSIPDAGDSPDGAAAADAPDSPDGPCPAGPAGLACLFALHDEVVAGCDPARLVDLDASLAARHGDLPAWRDGRALFLTRGGPAAIAGSFNGWDPTALATAPLCGGDLHTATAAVPSGRHEYKLVRGDQWSLDPLAWAFAHDDYAANADGRNSVLNTYDSGLGHLVQPEEPVCSTELGNCRRFTTYLPPGYGAPDAADRTYPVLFMHDGQNIFDDPDCCFGHTGWEVNVRLDAEIAAGQVEEVVVVGLDHAGEQRIAEYGFSTADDGLQETFMAFQVQKAQPRAAALWRIDLDRAYTAGSSLGGLIAYRLAFAYPEVYRGAASLSGAFWPGQDTGTAMRDLLAAAGLQPIALYLDHGGTAEGGGDGYADNLELRDLLVAAGWERADSPDCTVAPEALCYFHDAGATHDELAWRDRSWRFLRYFFAK